MMSMLSETDANFLRSVRIYEVMRNIQSDLFYGAHGLDHELAYSMYQCGFIVRAWVLTESGSLELAKADGELTNNAPMSHAAYARQLMYRATSKEDYASAALIFRDEFDKARRRLAAVGTERSMEQWLVLHKTKYTASPVFVGDKASASLVVARILAEIGDGEVQPYQHGETILYNLVNCQIVQQPLYYNDDSLVAKLIEEIDDVSA